MTDDIADAPATAADDDRNPFDDLAKFLEIPRVTGLALAPDGSRLAVGVQNLSPDGKKFVSSVWEVDRDGGAPFRLTRSAAGESAPAFLPDGSLLFLAKRPDPEAKDGDDGDGSGLWLLPARGGEARLLAAPPAGVGSVAVAPKTGRIVLSAKVMPEAKDLAEDAERRKARKDANVTAILHAQARIREWDTQLGPEGTRLFVAEAPGADGKVELRDLTGDLGPVVDSFAVDRDGSRVVYGLVVPLQASEHGTELRLLDVASGKSTLFAGDTEHEYSGPVISPDGATVAYVRGGVDTFDESPPRVICVQPLAGGPATALTEDLDRWPQGLVWAPDSSALYFTADEMGRAPVFKVDVATSTVTRLTGDRAAYSSLQVTPDGSTLFALRSATDAPARPVRLDAGAADQEPVLLSAPGDTVPLPGRVEEVTATAEDGTVIHSRLVLPDGADAANPAPLLVWIHGGPMMSSNAWGWRANPWVMVSQGYAVLLTDYSLSTGYGQEFLNRGKGEKSGNPFHDLMAATDAVLTRPEIDGTRTAAMGGSFGGYLTNWIATQTDRFKALISHAGVWNAQLRTVSDVPWFFRQAYGDVLSQPEHSLRWSPHLYADNVSTPMLIIHGNNDYRVPVANALWQWQDLQRRGKEAKFLYFPDENHWVLRPQESKLWYETVRAFLAEHVLGQAWEQPELL
ncbi:S9 family peptidase [Catenulispora pinisilvae]|uniref:S9 family peptidase n=1 Tax=Catenulispora pinisilvae TaxID=2705253 RepID=UPI002B27A01B|nr:S9 family peptidase [Catenulispora pinisilvae]